MSIAPTDPSLTRSMNKDRPQRRTQTVPYLNCDRHNTFTFVAPSFILLKHSQMLTPEIHTYAKYPARIGGSYGSITEYRHRCIKPQILHQKLTYLYQLVYHAFQQQSIYSTKYMKGYKAACLNIRRYEIITRWSILLKIWCQPTTDALTENQPSYKLVAVRILLFSMDSFPGFGSLTRSTRWPSLSLADLTR
jgi:hypothetical protein